MDEIKMHLQMVIHEGEWCDLWMWLSPVTGKTFGVLTKNGVWVDSSSFNRNDLRDMMTLFNTYEDEKLKECGQFEADYEAAHPEKFGGAV